MQTSSIDAARMILPGEALERVRAAAVRRAAVWLPPAEALGLVLAAPVASAEDHPPFPRAMMDGYAVTCGDAGQSVAVAGEIAAGDVPRVSVEPGRGVEIMTGAAVPRGADCVVPRENTAAEGDRVRLPKSLTAGEHIAPRGSECRRGETVLACGQTVTPLAVGALAALGVDAVPVIARPQVAVIVTGSELCDGDPGPFAIRDSNGPMLAALVRAAGGRLFQQGRCADRLDRLTAQLDEAAGADIVLLSGGVSAGKYDLVPEAIARCGGRLLLHRVRQKPGKPLLVACRGEQLLFGLPGNPLACHFCFCRYVTAAIRGQMGKPPGPLEMIGTLAAPVETKPGRSHFIPAAARWDAASSRWRLHPAPSVSSADLFHSHAMNGYVEVPPGRAPMPAGAAVPFAWALWPEPLLPEEAP